MTYQTVVSELVQRFPELQEEVRGYMDDAEPLPYVVLGCVILPRLENALREGELAVILRICAYLEDMALGSRTDELLGNLLHIEIGEWLCCAAHEDRLAPWLGPETKRICGYVPGLATQRRQLKEEKAQKSLKHRLKRIFSTKS